MQRWEKMLRFKVKYEGECGLFKGLKLGNIWQSSFLRLQPWQSIPHHLKYLLFLEILATLAIPYQLKYLTSIIIKWTLEINFSAKEAAKLETWNESKTCRSQWLNSFVFSKIFQCVWCMWLQIYILIDFGFILFDFGSTYWIFDFDFDYYLTLVWHIEYLILILILILYYLTFQHCLRHSPPDCVCVPRQESCLAP